MPKSGFLNVFSHTYIAPYYILMEDSICLMIYLGIGYDNGRKETSWLSDAPCGGKFCIIALHFLKIEIGISIINIQGKSKKTPKLQIANSNNQFIIAKNLKQDMLLEIEKTH
jgi:hypothetical protein